LLRSKLAGFVVEMVGKYQTERDRRPWKVYSARLQDALEAMKADAAKIRSQGRSRLCRQRRQPVCDRLKVIDAGKDSLRSRTTFGMARREPGEKHHGLRRMEDSKVSRSRRRVGTQGKIIRHHPTSKPGSPWPQAASL